MLCKKCGSEIVSGAKFCGECGTPIEYEHKVCAHCGAELPMEATFCGHCGKTLQKEDTVKKSDEFLQKDNSVKQSEKPSNKSEDNSKISIDKRLLAIIIAVVVVIVAVFVVIAMNSNDDSNKERTKTQQEEGTEDTLSTEEEATEKGDSDTLAVEDSGFSFEDEYAYCGFRIKNKSNGTIKEAVFVRLTAKSSSGKILGTGQNTMLVSLKKGEPMVYSQMLECEKKPASVELEILDGAGDYTDIDELKVENTHFSKKEYNSAVTGEVNNTRNKEYESSHIDVIFKNKKGEIIGGLDTYLGKIKGKRKTAFSVDCYHKFENDNFEVYAIGYNY